ncbi:hypothetical protein CYMTET_25483 [Cymbomonas tetramitiformis]|uniref:Uncharacterized protein n=1 Tax=Cymbomonas tetramitiformis TaxID=36881 RepID=A0AAE0KZ73_9CHLO|nr:hypothetical protein CYMTET_25483 [Cymbomonas tetramitiformis]
MAAQMFATGRCAFRCKPALLQVGARGRPCTRATGTDRAQVGAKISYKPEEKRSKSKETVVIFERRGEGWGEELFPSVSVSTREVLAKKPRRDRDLETALGNLEFLGIEADEGRGILEEASSWRTTRQGRALIDKKLRKRVQRNVAVIACLLQEKYGVEYERTAALVRDLPLVLSIDFTDSWADNYLDYMLARKGLLDVEHQEQVEARSSLSEPVNKAASTVRVSDMTLEVRGSGPSATFARHRRSQQATDLPQEGV